MMIKIINENKESFLDLLLLADDEVHIRNYLSAGEMFVLFQAEIAQAVCLVKNNEIENLAVAENSRGQGLGKKLLDYVCTYYQNQSALIVGTDDKSGNVQFYEKCGFVVFKTIKNYFIENYAEEIYENEEKLIDKVYLKKNLSTKN